MYSNRDHLHIKLGTVIVRSDDLNYGIKVGVETEASGVENEEVGGLFYQSPIMLGNAEKLIAYDLGFLLKATRGRRGIIDTANSS